jgi:hypothetical protein
VANGGSSCLMGRGLFRISAIRFSCNERPLSAAEVGDWNHRIRVLAIRRNRLAAGIVTKHDGEVRYDRWNSL